MSVRGLSLKVGDKLVCNKDNQYGLTKGKIYTVLQILEEGAVNMEEDSGEVHLFLSRLEYFDKVKKTIPIKHYSPIHDFGPIHPYWHVKLEQDDTMIGLGYGPSHVIEQRASITKPLPWECKCGCNGCRTPSGLPICSIQGMKEMILFLDTHCDWKPKISQVFNDGVGQLNAKHEVEINKLKRELAMWKRQAYQGHYNARRFEKWFHAAIDQIKRLEHELWSQNKCSICVSGHCSGNCR